MGPALSTITICRHKSLLAQFLSHHLTPPIPFAPFLLRTDRFPLSQSPTGRGWGGGNQPLPRPVKGTSILPHHPPKARAEPTGRPGLSPGTPEPAARRRLGGARRLRRRFGARSARAPAAAARGQQRARRRAGRGGGRGGAGGGQECRLGGAEPRSPSPADRCRRPPVRAEEGVSREGGIWGGGSCGERKAAASSAFPAGESPGKPKASQTSAAPGRARAVCGCAAG